MSSASEYFSQSLFFKSRSVKSEDYGFIRCNQWCDGCGGVLSELTPLNECDLIPWHELMSCDLTMVGHCEMGGFVSFSVANDFDAMFKLTDHLLNDWRISSFGLEDSCEVVSDFMEGWQMTHDDIMSRTPEIFYKNMSRIFKELRRREAESEYLGWTKSQAVWH